MTGIMATFAAAMRGVANAELLETSINLVVPAKAGTQSIHVFDLRKDWIPAFAGKTKF
jgi:hypothetical protein